MLPLTAALAAFTAFNQFLITPAGQKLASDSEAIVTNLLSHFGVHLAPLDVPDAQLTPAGGSKGSNVLGGATSPHAGGA